MNEKNELDLREEEKKLKELNAEALKLYESLEKIRDEALSSLKKIEEVYNLRNKKQQGSFLIPLSLFILLFMIFKIIKMWI